MEDLGTLGRLGLEVYYCSCIPTTFSSGLLIAWRAVERFYAEGFGFLFDNTLCVVLVFASFFPSIFAFYYLLWVVILIGLDYLPILFIAFVHFPHTSCLT